MNRMRKFNRDEDGVAQVIEFAASITVIMIILTAFYTALGYQVGKFTVEDLSNTDKSYIISDYLIGDTGYVEGANTTEWASLENASLRRNFTRFGFAEDADTFGILSAAKINTTAERIDYDESILKVLGLATVFQGNVLVENNINITITTLDGETLLAWGHNTSQASIHAVATRIVLVRQDSGELVPARFKLDVM